MATATKLSDLEYYESLIALEPEITQRAQEVESDLPRFHLTQIASSIIGLKESLRQEAAWKRP